MRQPLRLVLASFLALPLAACGGVAPAPGIGANRAPRELARAICGAAYKCCTVAQLMGNDQAGTNVATCEEKTEAGFQGYVAGVEASQKKGRVDYDGLKVQACVDFLDASQCPALQMTNHFSGIPACASFITPKVALGGGCTNDFECVDSYCDVTGVAVGADGACRARAVEGASCASAPCASTLVCDGATKTCKALPAGGAPTATDQCFYTSGCSAAGGDRGAASVLTVGLLLVAIAWRRRARLVRATARRTGRDPR